MKKYLALLIFILCIYSATGCSNQTNLSGIYRIDTLDIPEDQFCNAVALHERYIAIALEEYVTSLGFFLTEPFMLLWQLLKMVLIPPDEVHLMPDLFKFNL